MPTQLEDYFDFSDAQDIRIKGHRVWIQHVLYPYVQHGKSAEEIAKDLPSLSLDKIYATILYYLLNKEAVTAYLKEWIEGHERAWAAQPPPSADFLERVRRVKAEHDARREQERQAQERARESQVSAG
jgi:uncharacterized protein (DUF433 family)